MGKEASLSPFYCSLYPALTEVAMSHGYALAVHGSVKRDFDLIAVPWIEKASDDEVLIKALLDHLDACHYRTLLRRSTNFTEDQIDMIDKREAEKTGKCPISKPHGRKSWRLYLAFGAYLDVSVMPKAFS